MLINNSRSSIADLYKNSDDYQTILNLYLDLSSPIKFVRHSTKSNWSFQAIGLGKDGEAQMVTFSSSSGIAREWESPRRRLPVEEGKVYWMLLEMGYDLGTYYTDIARRYENYAIHGVSNLRPSENRQSMIEKATGRLQKRDE